MEHTIFVLLIITRFLIIYIGTGLSIKSHRHLKLLTGIPHRLRKAGEFNTKLSYLLFVDVLLDFAVTLSYLSWQIPGSVYNFIHARTGWGDLASGVIAFTLLIIPYQAIEMVTEVVSLNLEKTHGFFESTRKALIGKLSELIVVEIPMMAALVLGASVLLGLDGWVTWVPAVAIVGVSTVLTLQQRVLSGKMASSYPVLPPGRLRRKLDLLAAHSGFPCVGICVSDTEDTEGSHAQAEFTGPFSKKTIILSPALLKRKDQEIVSLAAHELGHAYHKHAQVDGMILVCVTAMALGGAYLVQVTPSLTQMWGLPPTPTACVLSLTFWATIVKWWLDIPLKALRRFQEYQADAYAVALVRKLPRHLQVHPANAFRNLSVEELRLDEPAFTEFFLRDEPNISKRLAAMKEDETSTSIH